MTVSVVDDNEALETGDKYIYEASKGGYLISYPNQDVDTDFEFKVWLGD